MLRYTWIYVVALMLAALRVAGHKSEAFQAIAHLFVGGLFAAGYMQYQFTWQSGGMEATRKIWLGVALSILELVCALWFGIGATA